MSQQYEPGPMHGLPRELLPKQTINSWSEVIDYLMVLTRCERPIVAVVRDDRMPTPYTQLRGYLRDLGEWQPMQGHPSARHFGLDWPRPGEASGWVALFEHLFQGATLSTADGDDYFWFHLSFGSLTISFEDANRNT